MLSPESSGRLKRIVFLLTAAFAVSSEFSGALYYTGYFKAYDYDFDGYMSRDELAEHVFETWDLYDNVVLNRNEYRNFDFNYADL